MAITNKQIEELQQRKRELDAKLKQHEVSLRGSTKYKLTPKALEIAEKMAANRGVQNVLKNDVVSSTIQTKVIDKIKKNSQRKKVNEQPKVDNSPEAIQVLDHIDLIPTLLDDTQTQSNLKEIKTNKNETTKIQKVEVPVEVLVPVETPVSEIQKVEVPVEVLVPVETPVMVETLVPVETPIPVPVEVPIPVEMPTSEIQKADGTQQYQLTPKALLLAEKLVNTNKKNKAILNSINGFNNLGKSENGDIVDRDTIDSNNQRQKTKNLRGRKNPQYSKIPPEQVQPLKNKEPIADILAKLYNLMRKDYARYLINYRNQKKYNKESENIKEKHISELIELFGGKYPTKDKNIQKDKTQKNDLIKTLLKYGVILGAGILFTKTAFAKMMPAIPDFAKDILGFKGKEETPMVGPTPSLSSLIARGESGGSYDIYNMGEAGVAGPTLKISEMTVEEVMNLQSRKKIFAAGKYQIIPNTLKEAVISLNINKNEKFNADTQEKIFSEYLIAKKPGREAISKYLNSKDVPDEKTKHDALKQLAQEFAAIADPDTGKSFYGGKAKNKASISSMEVLTALESDRLTRQSALAKGNENPATPSTQQKTTEPLSKESKELPKSVSSMVPTKVPNSLDKGSSAVATLNSPITQTQPMVALNVSREIPTAIDSKANKTNSSMAVLNNITNVISGDTVYAMDEDSSLQNSSLIQKQYYS